VDSHTLCSFYIVRPELALVNHSSYVSLYVASKELSYRKESLGNACLHDDHTHVVEPVSVEVSVNPIEKIVHSRRVDGPEVHSRYSYK
jgi:hypothetical protein